MRHRQRRVGEFYSRKTAERHSLATVIDELHTLQRLGVLQIRRSQFHHHAVLVQRVVNHPNLALAETVAEHRVNGAHRQAQTGCRISVNHHRGLQATLFKVTADVFQFFEFGQGTA